MIQGGREKEKKEIMRRGKVGSIGSVTKWRNFHKVNQSIINKKAA
jgi:hypothetical protein